MNAHLLLSGILKPADPQRSLKLYVAVVAILGLLIASHAFLRDYSLLLQAPLLMFGFTLAALAIFSFPLKYVRAGEQIILDMDDLLFVVMALLLPTPHLLLALGIGGLIAFVLRGSSPIKVLLNVSAKVLAAGLGMAFIHPLLEAGLPAPLTVVLGAAVYNLVNQVLVSQAVALATQRPFWPIFTRSVTSGGVIWLAAVCAGLVVGLAAQAHLGMLLVSAVPVTVLLYLSNLSLRLEKDRDQLRDLLQVTYQVQKAQGRAQVEEMTRTILKELLQCEEVTFSEQAPASGELGVKLADGEDKRWLMVRRPRRVDTFRHEDVALLAAVAAVTSNALSRAALLEELAEQSIRDPLTGAFNRRYFDTALSQALQQAEAQGSPFSILLFDIDHFKRINDTLGHETGDKVLCQIAEVSRRAFRENDHLCRLGGDEFAILLPGLSLEGACSRAESFRRLAENACTVSGFGLSMGVVSYPVDGNSTEELLRTADQALYRAKRRGRGRVCSSSEVSPAAYQAALEQKGMALE